MLKIVTIEIMKNAQSSFFNNAEHLVTSLRAEQQNYYCLQVARRMLLNSIIEGIDFIEATKAYKKYSDTGFKKEFKPEENTYNFFVEETQSQKFKGARNVRTIEEDTAEFILDKAEGESLDIKMLSEFVKNNTRDRYNLEYVAEKIIHVFCYKGNIKDNAHLIKVLSEDLNEYDTYNKELFEKYLTKEKETQDLILHSSKLSLEDFIVLLEVYNQLHQTQIKKEKEIFLSTESEYFQLEVKRINEQIEVMKDKMLEFKEHNKKNPNMATIIEELKGNLESLLKEFETQEVTARISTSPLD